jgi:hypothetical protein
VEVVIDDRGRADPAAALDIADGGRELVIIHETLDEFEHLLLALGESGGHLHVLAY